MKRELVTNNKSYINKATKDKKWSFKYIYNGNKKEEKDGARGTNKTREKHTLKTPPCWNWEERSFRNPNLRKKKQVKKKIFDNFLNFASKSSLRVTIWDNLSRWIVYMTLKLSTMHLTNSATFKFNGKVYFAKFIQR